MNNAVEKQVQQPPALTGQKKEPDTLLSTVGTFETVMNHAAKFLTNPFILIVGLITTILLVTRGKNQNGSNLADENAELKEQIRSMQSDLTGLRREVRKLRQNGEETGYMNESQEYPTRYKAPGKLPPSQPGPRTLRIA